MSGPELAKSVSISPTVSGFDSQSSPPPPPPSKTVSSAVLADSISSMGVYLSLQYRAAITEESLGAEPYRQLVIFYTRFEACYTQEASKVLLRKKAVFLADDASKYAEESIRSCYHDACVDTYGKTKKLECEAAAAPAEAAAQ